MPDWLEAWLFFVAGWGFGLACWAGALVWANRHRELLIRWMMRRAAARMPPRPVKATLAADRTPGTGIDANLTADGPRPSATTWEPPPTGTNPLPPPKFEPPPTGTQTP